MPQKQPTRILEPVTIPQRYVKPSTRELRAHSVHRLQVGLFGLGTMLLLIGLANIIMDRAEQADVDDPMEQTFAADAPPKKPATDTLADIGVAPETDPEPSAESQGNESAGLLPAN